LPPSPLRTSMKRTSQSLVVSGPTGSFSDPNGLSWELFLVSSSDEAGELSRAVKCAMDFPSASVRGSPSLRFKYAFVASLACRFETTEFATKKGSVKTNDTSDLSKKAK